MNRKEKRPVKFLKQGLFLFLIILWLFPMLQGELELIISMKLNGYFEPTPRPLFSMKTWMNGDYQEKYMRNLEDSVSFRSDFVRLTNQIDYSLFSIPHPKNIVIGNKKMLFIWNYMMTWLGKGLKGEHYIDEKVKELKFLQDDLWNRKKIMLLVVFPPEKAWAYPENIPWRYASQKRVMGNYECYVRKCREYGGNTLDVNRWFMAARDTSKYLLFPWNGTHWSDYGAFLAADSLIRLLEAKMNRKFPHIVLNSIELSPIPRHNDNDISKLMNMIWEPSGRPLAVPHYHAVSTPEVKKTSVLFVGDSFFWGWDDMGLVDTIFAEKQFWYYNREVFPAGPSGVRQAADLNLKEEVEKRDVIIIIHVGGGVGDMGNGFIDDAYAVFDTTSGNMIRQIEKLIRNSPERMIKMEADALAKNKPVSQIIRNEAIWITNNELLKHK